MSRDECCACGKNLRVVKEAEVEGGLNIDMNICGMSLSISWGEAPPELVSAIQLNLGKYAPHDPRITAVEFKFCFECMIRALLHTADKKFQDKMESLWRS